MTRETLHDGKVGLRGLIETLYAKVYRDEAVAVGEADGSTERPAQAGLGELRTAYIADGAWHSSYATPR